MACNCESTINKCVYVNPCNIGTGLGIIATETGTYALTLSFNGTSRRFGIQVESGFEITILTSLLNENYVHDLVLVSPSNETTCYTISTSLAYGVSGQPIPNTNDTWEWARLSFAASPIIQSDLFKGDLSPELIGNEANIDWVGQGIIQDKTAGTLDFTSIGGFAGILAFQYKNLPQP